MAVPLSSPLDVANVKQELTGKFILHESLTKAKQELTGKFIWLKNERNKDIMAKLNNSKRLLSIFLLAAMLLGIVTACGDRNLVVEEISSVPVQFMTRESDEWAGEFASPVFEITGNGSYSAMLNVHGDYVSFPNIAVSAEGTNTADVISSEAKFAPEEYKNAVVTITSLKVNGNPLVLKNNENVLLIPDDGPLKGYINVQLWNAWWQPNQRIDIEASEGVVLLDTNGEYLQFSSPVNSFEIEFTVDNVGSDVPPTTQAQGNGDNNNNANDNNDEQDMADDNDDEEPFQPEDPVNVTITGEFDKDLTAEDLVREIGVGWNLGNTLDAYFSENPSEKFHWVDYDNMHELETAWLGGPRNATTQALIKRVKDSGFNAIRIPVTWYKMAGEAPDYEIDERWLSHVENIVNMAVLEDLYIIINTHHDEFIMRFDEDPAVGEGAVKALWKQIAERFKDYNEKLIFEGLNEPRARNNAWNTHGSWNWYGDNDKYIVINRWNQAFVNAVRDTGGNNEHRHLMLATYAAQSGKEPIEGFELPSDPVSGNGTDRFILSIHVYSPHSWAHDGNGSYNGDAPLRTDIERVANRAAELGVPVIFGEWGSIARLDIDERVQHAHDYIRIATEMRERDNNPVVMACFWWDNGGDFAIINRTGENKEQGQKIINAITRAREGLDLE